MLPEDRRLDMQSCMQAYISARIFLIVFEKYTKWLLDILNTIKNKIVVYEKLEYFLVVYEIFSVD